MPSQDPLTCYGGHRSFSARRRGPQPSASSEVARPTVAIVGGGFSGTLCALHLLRHCSRSRVLLIERHRQFGLGLAYATENPGHLLNVPAGHMSAFHNRPRDFVDWLEAREKDNARTPEVGEGSFIPREAFGTYIRHLLNEELKHGDPTRLELLRGEVLDITERDRLILTLDRGRRVDAHLAILAVGNFAPEPPVVADPWIYGSAWYRGDPWDGDTLTQLDPEASVLLIGTGLTMVDTALALLDNGHRGPMHALSRRGLLPRRHAASPGPTDFGLMHLPTNAIALLRRVREEIAEAQLQGKNWQSVVDALRPVTSEIWQSFPAEERRRFLRHLRPWWDVHRHRLPPAIAERIEGARCRGQLDISAGRISAYRLAEDGGRIAVDYRIAGEGRIGQMRVDRIINCSGPACDFERIRNPLIEAMHRQGQLRSDSLRLGLDVTLQGALKSHDNAISQRLYAIGPLTKGVFWEMTSVPDIRRQCELLATHLAQFVGSRRFSTLENPM